MAVGHVSRSYGIFRAVLGLLRISNASFALWEKPLAVTHCVDGFVETATQNAALSRNFGIFATCLTRRHFNSTIFRKGFTSSRINYYPNSVASYQVTLLLRSGYVDPNPSPCVTDLHNLSEQRNLNFNDLSTFYANARSIVNKKSKLELDIAASRYDIIALTETHLDNSISDCEILPNNYLVSRRDRKSNGRHVGGVLYRMILKPFHASLFRVNLKPKKCFQHILEETVVGCPCLLKHIATVVSFQATQWPCLATRLSVNSIDPVAC